MATYRTPSELRARAIAWRCIFCGMAAFGLGIAALTVMAVAS